MSNNVGEMIKRLRLEKGMTLEELGQKVGVGKSTVRKWENGMIANMRRDKIENLAVALGISPLDILGNEHEENRTLPSNVSTPAAYGVPILGTICAGDGVIAEQNYQGMFFVDKSIRADYCLHVHGDSMADAHIYDGDIAFLVKDFDFIDGEIYGVVYGSDNSSTLKKVFRADGKLILQPCNSKYKAIIEDPSDVYIVGELVGVYHNRKNME
ncbi:MAG: LexA family protein [Bilifractor sp.]|jgi:repressor LexA